ncbi:MAG TPA: proline iminopeptidase-family hydrolase [Sphingomonas sp.]|uniref:proline iminopeptidase-family hydrolase n=1 Tax=Sphingomonas sp. TaxID=28214 RepID=UPI002ED7DE88
MRALGRRALLIATAGGALAGRASAADPAVPPPTRELRVAVPGGSIYVRVNGRIGDGRAPLLLAHGGPGGCHASLVPALALAGDRAVILYDQLDGGRSDRPADPANWTVPRFVAEVQAIRAALDLDRLHLLGHSWGATIALEYGARRPAGLQSLILMGPLISTPAWLADAATLRARLPARVQAVLTACEGPNPPDAAACAAATDAFYARYWRLRPVAPAVAAYEASIPQCRATGLYEAMWGPSEFRATGTLRDYDGTALLARLDVPTLVMIGDQDEVTVPTARHFAGLAPRGELIVVPDAAHRLQSDRTDLFLAHLHDWLRRHDGDTA